MRREEWLLLVGSNLWYLGEGMLGPLFAVYTQQIGGDVLDITWAWSAYLVVTGILTIYFGRLADHVDKRKLLVAGYALNTVFTFMYLLVDSPFQLLLVQVGVGIAGAMATPPWDALYAKYEDAGSDGFLWGLSSGSASVILGIALLMGGFIVTAFGFKTLFIIMGCIQVVATLYQARILLEPKAI